MTHPSSSPQSEHGVLPLAPIEKPRGIFRKLFFRIVRARYGKTPTAFMVVYARFPAALLATIVLVSILDRFLKIGKELRFLLQIHLATQNGCTFCADLMLAEAVKAKVGREPFAELADYKNSSLFTDRQKAALDYTAALAQSTSIPDHVFDSLKQHFSEREITEIVWVCAVERYFNTMALPLRIGSDHLAA